MATCFGTPHHGIQQLIMHNLYTAPKYRHEVRSIIDGLIGLVVSNSSMHWASETCDCESQSSIAYYVQVQYMVGDWKGCPYPRCIPSKAISVETDGIPIPVGACPSLRRSVISIARDWNGTRRRLHKYRLNGTQYGVLCALPPSVRTSRSISSHVECPRLPPRRGKKPLPAK